ncbi:hypothetical protein [Nocardia vaccinii]|uniref:hypothetical protein n=1 Tax=Nocardia vaccinii TaxID=1822 RepID=UPI0012F47BB7|nr:hypothetical protein [Nocardia vaccinii]
MVCRLLLGGLLLGPEVQRWWRIVRGRTRETVPPPAESVTWPADVVLRSSA